MTSNDDDNELWDKFAKEITPLSAKDRNSVTLATKKARGVQPAPPDPTESFDTQTCHKIADGKIPIDATLDLHGFRLDEAHQRVLNLIKTARALDQRFLLIVTGKGKDGEGVLRKEVPRWLSQHPSVSGYEEADGRHGGSGALYVQVKRRR